MSETPPPNLFADRVTGFLLYRVSATTGVPQIAADWLQLPSRAEMGDEPTPHLAGAESARARISERIAGLCAPYHTPHAGR